MLESNFIRSPKRHCFRDGNNAFSPEGNNFTSPQPGNYRNQAIVPVSLPPCTPSTPKSLCSGVAIDPCTSSPQFSSTSSCCFDLALVDELEEQALHGRSVDGFGKQTSPRIGHDIVDNSISSPYNLKGFDPELVDYLEETAKRQCITAQCTIADIPANNGGFLEETKTPDGKAGNVENKDKDNSFRKQGRSMFIRFQVHEAFHHRGEEGYEIRLVVVAENELLSQENWISSGRKGWGERQFGSANPLPTSSHLDGHILEEAKHRDTSTTLTAAQYPRSVILRHDWSQACISPGDIIHVVFLDSGNTGCPSVTNPIIIDRERNLLVHHPDVLVAPTQVAEAVHCERMAVLRSRIGGSMGRSNKSCAIGSIKHELFERALLAAAKKQNKKESGGFYSGSHSDWSNEMRGWCNDIIRGSLKDLYATGIKDKEAKEELFGVIPFLCGWIRDFVSLTNAPLRAPPPTNTDEGSIAMCSRGKDRNALVRIDSVLATEDEIWSPIFGLRGCLDVSAKVSFSVREDGSGLLFTDTLTVPVELKTGKRSEYVIYDHRAQVVMYSLMIQDRYRGDIRIKSPPLPSMCCDGISGLLVYMGSKGVYTEVVTPNRHELVALVQARNRHAADVYRSKLNIPFTLPRPIYQRSQCDRCFQAPECMLYQRAERLNEGPTSETLYKETGHLSDAQIDMFRQWDLAIDCEAAEESVRKGGGQAIWNVPSRKREFETGLCMSGIAYTQQHVVEMDDCEYYSLKKRKRYIHTFVRQDNTKGVNSRLFCESGGPPISTKPFLNELSFQVGDCVMVGLEGDTMNGGIKQQHVVRLLRGKIVRLTRDEVDLICDDELGHVPGYSSGICEMSGDDGDLKPLCEASFRLDISDTTAGMKTMKANLVRLFVGGEREEGSRSKIVDHQQGQQLIEKREKMGDCDNLTRDGKACRLRSLVVDLARPRFAMEDGVEEVGFEIFPRTQVGQELAHKFTTELNKDQQASIRRAFMAKDYTLLLGMPGTGKTATICFLCELMIAHGKSVLVTSYTHSAVDNLLLRLIEKGVDCLRVASASSIGSVHPGVRQRCLLERVEGVGGEIDPNPPMFSLNITEEYRMAATSSLVVGATCLGAAQHPLFDKRTFDHCIVDEAGQITIPAILPALRCSRVFCLVGDFKQLAPLVISKSAKRAGLDISLIQRLSEAHPDAQIQLGMQYRMNEDITHLCNAVTYGGGLICGNSVVAGRRLRLVAPSEPCEYPQWLKAALEEERSVVFLDTDSYKMQEREKKVGVRSSGVVSQCEATIVRLLLLVLEKSGVGGAEIGVISPYRSQVALILAIVAGTISGKQKKWLSEVEIKTIDKYQGRDKKVIVLSLACSNDAGNIGNLLHDWRRVNVALSRAQQKLVLVGSLKTLSSAGVGSAPQKLSRVIFEKDWVVKTIRETD